MKGLGLKEIGIIVLLGAVGWALCGAIVFIGRSLTDMQTTLIIHAIGAPIIFTLLSMLYFSSLNTRPHCRRRLRSSPLSSCWISSSRL